LTFVAAYARYSLAEFIAEDDAAIIGTLQTRYAHDGFASQYTQQTKAWERMIPLLKSELRELMGRYPHVAQWGVLLEYPLHRLRKRIDAVLLAGQTIVVVEAKVGQASFRGEDEAQVEEYALDLRDFHAMAAS
jgi:hypothetical protein